MAKTTTRWLLAGLLWLVLWPSEAYAQSPELLDAAKRSDELYAEGRYQEALPFAEKALGLVEREFGPDHPNTAAFLSNLAEVLQVQGRYAEAKPLCVRALEIWEKVPGPDHRNTATDLTDLARHGCDLAAMGVFSRYPE